MPLEAIASAISRTVRSSIFVWNLFQLFQPMGGVCARPFAGTSRRGGSSTFGSVAASKAGARYDGEGVPRRAITMPMDIGGGPAGGAAPAPGAPGGGPPGAPAAPAAAPGGGGIAGMPGTRWSSSPTISPFVTTFWGVPKRSIRAANSTWLPSTRPSTIGASPNGICTVPLMRPSTTFSS
jgi:hypothetical protein